MNAVASLASCLRPLMQAQAVFASGVASAMIDNDYSAVTSMFLSAFQSLSIALIDIDMTSSSGAALCACAKQLVSALLNMDGFGLTLTLFESTLRVVAMLRDLGSIRALIQHASQHGYVGAVEFDACVFVCVLCLLCFSELVRYDVIASRVCFKRTVFHTHCNCSRRVSQPLRSQLDGGISAVMRVCMCQDHANSSSC
jgi:hypothetical protein